MTTAYQDFMNEHRENLDLYTKTIAKVHGKNHPELSEVRELFQSINAKTQSEEENPDLKHEFTELRKVSNNYDVPADGCETYQATYKLLEEADEVYNDSVKS